MTRSCIIATLLFCALDANAQEIIRRGYYESRDQVADAFMPESLYTNAVAWLPFDFEFTPAGDYLDASEQVNDAAQATASAQPTFVAASGATSAHYDFDGTADFVTLTDVDALSFGDASTDSAFSMCAWVYMDDNASFCLFEKGAAKTTAEFHMVTGGGGAAGRFQFAVFDANDSNFMLDQAPVVNTGEWVHIAGTYSGSGSVSGLKVYTNGVVCPDNPITAGSYTAMHNTAAALSIGRNDALFPASRYANGKVSDWRLYNRELSAAELLDIHTDTKAAHP